MPVTRREDDQLDITLEELRFLLTLFDCQSLTAAAALRGLSMGAASRALARLRKKFQDDLFSRSGLKMLPTARMRALQPKVKNVLAATHELFEVENPNLQESTRTVHILSMDNGILSLLNEAIGHIYRAAPNITLRISPIDDRLLDRLRSGEADMALYPIRDLPKDFHGIELYRTRRGILVRENHPLIELYNTRGRITLEDLNRYRKIAINFSGAPLAKTALDTDATEQRAGCVMPYFLAVPLVLQQTDFTYTAPAITLRHFVTSMNFGLRMLPAPPEVIPFSPCLFWHHSTHEDKLLGWVRKVVVSSSRTLARKADVILEG